MENMVKVRHISVEMKADFKHVTQIFEQSLGRFDVGFLDGFEIDPQTLLEKIKEVEGKDGLMLFNILDHGKLLNIFGTSKMAKQYVLGNPLIATMMTRHDIRAGLYAPLRTFVYEADNRSTRIEYDQPSSLFGQFNNPEVTAVAVSLDAKLASLINKVERLATKLETA